MSNHISEQLGGDDLIFYTVAGNVYSGGFSVDSMLMKGGLSPLMSITSKTNEKNENNNNSDNIQVGGLFGNLVVPPMWFLSSTNPQQGGTNLKRENWRKENNSEEEESSEEEDGYISEDLHDKLLQLMKVAPKRQKKGTAKYKRDNKNITNKYSRKNKN